MQSKKCLVISSSKNVVSIQLIRQTLQNLGIEVYTLQDILFIGATITETLNKVLMESDFVIVDLSQASNNVMLELGIALGKNKPVLLLTEDNSQIPWDIHGLRVTTYSSDPVGISRLEALLKIRIMSLLKDSSPFVFENRSHGYETSKKRKKESKQIASEKVSKLLNIQAAEELNVRGEMFERLAADLMRNAGFDIISQGGISRDWPVDFVAWYPDHSRFLLVECKARDVNTEDIRRLSAILDNKQVNMGLILTSGKATAATKDIVAQFSRENRKFVLLLDREDLEKISGGTSMSAMIDEKTRELLLGSWEH